MQKRNFWESLLADWWYKGKKRVIIGEKTIAKKGMASVDLVSGCTKVQRGGRSSYDSCPPPPAHKRKLLVVLGTMGQSKQGHSRRSRSRKQVAQS